MTEKLTSAVFKYNLLVAGTYFGIDIVKWLYKLCTKKDEVNDVLFMRQIDCNCTALQRNNVCDNRYCYNYTFREIKSLIDGAQHSLYICMNIFTSEDLCKVVLRAHERGVAVKLIVNSGTDHASGSQVSELYANGIRVRKLPKTGNDVHHKFCLIDSDIPTTNQLRDQRPKENTRTIPKTGVLLTGSMNWTFQAMDRNWENVMVTSDEFFVSEFHKEFIALWNHEDFVDFE